MDKRKIVKKWNSKEKRESLRTIRRMADVSLADVARLAGLSESMVSKYELGQRDLSFEALAKLHRAVGHILDEKDAKEARRRHAEQAASREMAELLGEAIPLASLADPQKYSRSLAERRAKMEREYGPYWKEVFGALFEQAREKRDLEKRIAELRDLLKLETEVALKESEAIDLREKIKSRDSE